LGRANNEKSGDVKKCVPGFVVIHRYIDVFFAC
jgi:hypothetical protein